MSLINDIIERKNLLSAWLKVKQHLLNYDGWVDIEDLYSFEATLNENLTYISDQFSEKKWKLKEMVPLPRLKIERNEDRSIKEKIRQDFWVPIIDQVAWVAVLNVIGPILDLQMPGWSFANRLYRSILYEDTNIAGEEKSKVGPYRHYSGKLYRPWHTGWALYRRLSYLTWLSMTKSSSFPKIVDTLSEGDRKVYRNYVEYPVFDDYSWKIQYLERDYWNIKPDNNIFYAKIDFKDFFPFLKRDAVLEGIVYGLRNFKDYTNEQVEIDGLIVLLKQMIQFSWNEPNWTTDEKNCAYLNQKNCGIPVGLYVSGFLANVALLPIEAKLQNELLNKKPGEIAHFRYVDDHLILSPHFGTLIHWIQNYKKMVKNIDAQFNNEKVEPKELRAYLEQNKSTSEKIKAREMCTIDSQNPKQFITQTLALISDVAQKDFGLLHFNEQQSLLEELRHLLKTDLQKDEIKNDTRMTFAINRIIRLIVDWQRDWTELVALREKHINEFEEECIDETVLENIRILENFENENYLKIIKSSFSDLIDTIVMFPDKLRLWRLIINFCRKTGYEGWQDLGVIFYKQKNKNKRQYKFIKSLIWQEISKQIVETVKDLKNPVHLYSWELEAQTKFFGSIEKWKETLPLSPKPEEFEKISWNYLNNSIKLAKFIKNEEEPNFSFKEPVLYYWAEILSTPPGSTEPTKLWLNNIGKLDENNHIVQILMLMYPKEVAKLIPDQFKKIVSSFHKKQTAWEWEGNNFQKNIKGAVNLVTWCEWARKRQNECNERNIYDPRIGEWTALEILRQILSIYQLEVSDIKKLRKLIRKKSTLIHPANFIISEKWIEDCEKEKLTWEYWRNIVRDPRNSIREVKSGSIKYDNRISPLWLTDAGLDQQTVQLNNLLYESGLLLLGMLRKSFSWPSRWNLPGYSRDWRNISKEWFSLCACSSNTLSILEALLLPRHVESRDIKEHPKFNYKFEDDTIYDPVPIRDIDEINERIIAAQQKLKENQISSFLGTPRQLVPITIPDLIRRKWLRTDE